MRYFVFNDPTGSIHLGIQGEYTWMNQPIPKRGTVIATNTDYQVGVELMAANEITAYQHFTPVRNNTWKPPLAHDVDVAIGLVESLSSSPKRDAEQFLRVRRILEFYQNQHVIAFIANDHRVVPSIQTLLDLWMYRDRHILLYTDNCTALGIPHDRSYITLHALPVNVDPPTPRQSATYPNVMIPEIVSFNGSTLNSKDTSTAVVYDYEPTTTTDVIKNLGFRFPAKGNGERIDARTFARIQTFPETYFFPHAASLTARLIGKAIPPLFVNRIVGQLLSPYQ